MDYEKHRASMRTSSKLIKIFSVGVLTLFASFIFFIIIIKFSDIRPMIVWGSKLFTDYELSINGPLNIKVFPELSLHAKRASIKHKADYLAQDFINIEEIYVRLDSKKLILNNTADAIIKLNQFNMNIELEADGKTNLDRIFSANTNVIGQLSGNIELGGEASSIGFLKENLSGSIDIILNEGKWLGIDIWHRLRTARAIYKRENSPEMQSHDLKGTFSLRANGTVLKSIFINNVFTVDMPFTSIIGQGNISLLDGIFDYSIDAKFEKELQSVLQLSDEELFDFSEGTMPIRVHNKDKTVSFRPDIEGIFRNQVERSLLKQDDILNKSIKQRLLNQLR